MSSPLSALMNQQNNPMEQQFLQFMQQMQGKDPNAIIQQMLQSGQISQQQLNAVQQKAQQMQGMFGKFRGMFGK